MVDEGDTNLSDSTSNGNDLTKTAMGQPADAAGLVYKGQYFDGVGDGVDTPDGFPLNSDFTCSSLFKPYDNGTNRGLWNSHTFHNYPGSYSDIFSYRHTTNLFRMFRDDGLGGLVILATINTILVGNWYQLTKSWDGTDARVYRNGVVEDTQGTTWSDPGTTAMRFGAYKFNAIWQSWCKGWADELRLSTVKRSDDWIMAEYRTVDETLLTFGAETPV